MRPSCHARILLLSASAFATACSPHPGDDVAGGSPDTEAGERDGSSVGGIFTDVTRRSGIEFRLENGKSEEHYLVEPMLGGVGWIDFDGDGLLDLYLANGHSSSVDAWKEGKESDRLYRNTGDGAFEDVTGAAGIRERRYSNGVAVADYDNDGHSDLLVTNIGRNTLYHNRGDGTFEDVASSHGLDHAWLPMGANFGDLDNDGWLDVYLATGDPKYESLVPNAMLRNDEGRGFQDVTTSGGFGHLQKGHGVSFADIDSDGDQDIYHQLGGFYPGDAFHNALFENPGHAHHFLTLELRGVESHVSGSGARVEVRVAGSGGERSIHRAPGCVSSFGGSPARLEIGLGDAERIVSVRISWPVSGKTDSHEDVPLDARLRATEGAALLERLPYEPIVRR